MGSNRIRRIRKTGQQYNLFFIKPRTRANAHEHAQKLAMLSNVSEVMVTEGECGFIVKARNRPGPGSDVASILSRSSYKKITSYYQYRR